MPIIFDLTKKDIFDRAIAVMMEFREAFGRDLKPDFIAELYAAQILHLSRVDGINVQGYDAFDSGGYRYEIKSRNAQNVDVNSFDFDFIILINLDRGYRVKGMWKMTVEKAREVFVFREKFRKYQTTQDKFKSLSIRIV